METLSALLTHCVGFAAVAISIEHQHPLDPLVDIYNMNLCISVYTLALSEFTVIRN